MSTDRIARHIPYLRRYARALTGGQEEGDALVQAALEALLDGSLALATGAPLRLALFHAFHACWRRRLNGWSIDAEPRRRAEDRLQTLTPEHRTVVLLTLMEGFSLEEAAFILGVDEATAQARYAAAYADIERQLATEVLIIEDEPVIAIDLEKIVTGMGHRVVGVAATRDAAVGLAADRRPGLVLADIRLADESSGIEAATEILATIDVPVIFITAYPERLLTGTRPEPAFLITKPFSEDAVKALIGQALFFHEPRRRLPVA